MIRRLIQEQAREDIEDWRKGGTHCQKNTKKQEEEEARQEGSQSNSKRIGL